MLMPWLTKAMTFIGLTEIPGAKTAPTIAGWLAKLGAWWGDDETPWCGVYVAACFSGLAASPKHWYRAKAWLDWGIALHGPAVGCVVVFTRDGGGHVGFVVGRDTLGRLLVLGGNQGNAVKIAPFMPGRVAGYRWPSEYASTCPTLTSMESLPVKTALGAASVNEA